MHYKKGERRPGETAKRELLMGSNPPLGRERREGGRATRHVLKIIGGGSGGPFIWSPFASLVWGFLASGKAIQHPFRNVKITNWEIPSGACYIK